MATRHKWADVIIAFAEGKVIQHRYKMGDWYDTSKITNVDNPDFEWRVKPEKKTGWINIYPRSEFSRRDGEYAVGASVYISKDLADTNAHRGRIACIQIEYEEGQGL